MASKFGLECELKTSAEKLWINLKEFATFYPKALPHSYQSIEVVEGDGKSVGSVLFSTFTLPNSMVTTMKVKIDLVDDETKTLSYIMLEGELLKYYKKFKDVFVVCSKGEGALVKYSAVYDKASEDAPDPELVLTDYIINLFQDLDAYLLKTQ